ncbi:WSN domain-containing protein [Caenorhabditis elegans]|uniref:WSN domain-containing protein n=1 Tax=Caenorhabditis elegans TaxID=6239 RepID=C3JXD8_CAEEL|nr:WSN domain-containing protein [Caenorhabditis elegans]CCD71673.1 WSN domain-containing protein [Caenorhabditis elegans]|eukprot:NP_497484.2 Modifier Of Apl-1 activity [Caenorhabditis elegans]
MNLIPIVSLILWNNVHGAQLLPDLGADDIGKDNEYFSRRNPRATNKEFKSSLIQMQMISRVTNGIYLQHGLSNGSIKSDDLIPELLHFGTITPTQISAINTDKLSKIVEGINGLKLDGKVGQVEKQLIEFVSKQEELSNIDPSAIVPKDDPYMKELKDLKGRNVPWAKLETGFKKDLNYFLSEMNDFNTTSDLDNLQRVISAIALCKRFDPTPFKSLSNFKLLRDKYNDSPMMTKARGFLKEFKNEKVEKANLETVHKNIDSLSSLAEDLKTNQHVIETLHHFFEARQLPIIDSKYLAGFPKGISDISMVFTDLGTAWVNQTVAGQASNLGKALNQVKILVTKAAGIDQSVQSGEATILKELSEIHPKIMKFVDFADTVKPFVGAVTDIKLPVPSGNVPTFDNLDKFTKSTEELSLKLLAADKLVGLSKALHDSMNQHTLDNMSQIVNVTDAKFLESVQKINETYKLIFKEKGSMTTLSKGTILKDVTTVVNNFKHLKAFVEKFKKFKKDLEFLNKIKKIEPVINFIKDYRGKTPNKVGLPILISSLPSIKEKLGNLTAYINGIKSSKDKETEALSVFTNIAKDSQVIGMVTRGITSMEEMASQKVDWKPLKDLSAAIKVMKKMNPADVKKLEALAGLENEWKRIKGEVGTFINSVKPVNSTKLSDYSGIFQAAKSVNGLKTNLSAIISSVETLKSRLPSRRKRAATGLTGAQLDKLLALLRPLQIYDPTIYSAAFDASAKSLQALVDSFTEYGKILAKPPPPKPPAPSPGGAAPRQGAAKPSSQNAPESISLWPYIAIGVIILLAIAGLGIFFGLRWWSKKQVKSDLVLDPAPTKTIIAILPDAVKYICDRDRRYSDFRRNESTFDFMKFFKTSYENKVANMQSPEVSDLVKKHEMDLRVANPLIEKTRVILKGYKKQFNDNFLHANYVTCPDGMRFILMQSPQCEILEPKPAKEKEKYTEMTPRRNSTIEKFWWMIRQEKVEQVVMTCDFLERNRETGLFFENCSKYYPMKVDTELTFKGITVKCTNMVKVDGIERRTLCITFGDGVQLTVTHNLMSSWTYLNTQKTTISIISLIQYLNKCKGAPIVIHDHDGISRSATIPASIIGYQKIAETSGAFVLTDVIDYIREHRALAISTPGELSYIDAVIVRLLAIQFKDQFSKEQTEMCKSIAIFFSVYSPRVHETILDGLQKKTGGDKLPEIVVPTKERSFMTLASSLHSLKDEKSDKEEDNVVQRV